MHWLFTISWAIVLQMADILSCETCVFKRWSWISTSPALRHWKSIMIWNTNSIGGSLYNIKTSSMMWIELRLTCGEELGRAHSSTHKRMWDRNSVMSSQPAWLGNYARKELEQSFDDSTILRTAENLSMLFCTWASLSWVDNHSDMLILVGWLGGH